MQSLLQNLGTEVANLKAMVNDLKECSNIVRWNFSGIITMTGDYQWERLNDHGQKIQKQLLTQYNRFIQLLRFLTSSVSVEQQGRLEVLGQEVFNIMKQNNILLHMDKESWFTSAEKALDQQINLVSAEYQVTNECCLLVPDADVLLANFELDQWKFKEINTFEILLLPTVVSELNERTQSNTQAKNKIGQYKKQHSDRLVNDLENLKESLPWLTLNDNHDRIIAGYLEILKAKQHSQVVLVTNTLKLQEKAGLSYVPYIALAIPKNESIPANPNPPDHPAKLEAAATAVNKPVPTASPVVKPANTPQKVAVPTPALNKPILNSPRPNKPRPAKSKTNTPIPSIKAKQISPSASNRVKPTR